MRSLALLLAFATAVACKRGAPEPAASAVPPAPTGPCSEADVETVRIEECEARCTSGVAEACAVAAKKYWGGVGVRQSTQRVVELAERGCELGSGHACGLVSSAATGMHDGIDGVFKDPARVKAFGAKAFPLLVAACDKGDSFACDNAGFWLEKGLSVEKDPAKAATFSARAKALWRAGCDAGQGFLCGRLALSLLAGGKQAEAKPLYQRACELGHAPSCEEAGSDADDAKRLALLEKACQLGFARPCKDASLLKALDGDDGAAFRLLERACALRHAEACSQLADELRERDAGVLADEAMTQACALGSVACRRQGL